MTLLGEKHLTWTSSLQACRFFARGFCAAGDTCHFAHPAVDGSTTSTTDVDYDSHQYNEEEEYWEAEGDDEEEEGGEFDVALWEEWAGEDGSGIADWEKRPLCQRFMANGLCAAWHTCEAIHGMYCEVSFRFEAPLQVRWPHNFRHSDPAACDLTQMLTQSCWQTCQRFCLHPYDGKHRLQHVRDCAERADREDARAASAEQDCGICLERVMDKAAFSERRFGLLDCEHIFCLGCVRSWRCQVDGDADVDTVSILYSFLVIKYSLWIYSAIGYATAAALCACMMLLLSLT